MPTDEKMARRKLSLPELAQAPGSVGKACRIIGHSRQQLHEIRRNYRTFGAAGLPGRARGPRNPHPDRVAPETRQAILDHALEHPSHGPMRVAHELALRSVQVSAVGVRPPRSADGRSCGAGTSC